MRLPDTVILHHYRFPLIFNIFRASERDKMSSRLAELREKSKRRKEYLKVTLGVDNLSEALGSDKTEPQASRRRLDSDKEEARGCEECPQEAESGAAGGQEADTEFRDSTAFLKGTQSLNPHNDYSQNFVDTGQRPQNFIRDTG